MNIKKIRAINFWWGLISGVLILGVVVVGWELFDNQTWFKYFAINLILSFTLFWSFFLVFTCFKKNKYPYITYVPEYKPAANIFKKITYVRWIWIYIVPIIAAIICPSIFLSVQLKNDLASFQNIKAIIFYLSLLIIIIVNNLSYTTYISKFINNKDIKDEFTMRID